MAISLPFHRRSAESESRAERRASRFASVVAAQVEAEREKVFWDDVEDYLDPPI